MENLCFTSTQSLTIPNSILSPPFTITRPWRNVYFPHSKTHKTILLLARKKNDLSDVPDEIMNKLDKRDLIELDFGRKIGENPKLTLTKIMERKVDSGLTFMEVEKYFNRKKGNIDWSRYDVDPEWTEVSFEDRFLSDKPVPIREFEVDLGADSSEIRGLKRPVRLVKNKLGGATNSKVLGLSLRRPKLDNKVRAEFGGGGGSMSNLRMPNVILQRPGSSVQDGEVPKSDGSHITLRKPTLDYRKDDDKASRLNVKPDLTLSVWTEPLKENSGGMTLLKRPEPGNMEKLNDASKRESINESVKGLMNGAESGYEVGMTNGLRSTESSSDVLSLLQKPRAITPESMSNGTPGMPGDGDKKNSDPEVDMVLEHNQSDDILQTGTQQLAQTGAECFREEIGIHKPSYLNSESSVLLGRPKRLDSSTEDIPNVIEKGTDIFLERSNGESEPGKPSLLGPLTETEDADWARMELHFNRGDRVGVELISCSGRGFAACFGSLTGFLPYRSIPTNMKFLVFESWLRRNGLNPSNYSEKLGIVGTDNYLSESITVESIPPSDEDAELDLTEDMELEDLLRIYEQEKIKHLSFYLGQRFRVHISVADKKSRKLIFSMTGRESVEEIGKRRRLMAKLSVGDVVKCYIKKITYFGIFVEIEGVSALIHQSDVSWDPALKLASTLKIGQVIDAKVHQLDFLMDRIYLSLKETTPDPVNEAMECIVGNSSFSGGLESMQADTEWSEVDSLVKELEECNGIQAVTKGRFFLSPSLAPTFQVYMASTVEDRYKLLVRSVNKVQEVLVQSSLDKEEMKSIISKCTATLAL